METHLVRASVALPVGADGVVPQTGEDVDEWPALANGFCRSMRIEQAYLAPCAFGEQSRSGACTLTGEAALDTYLRECPVYDYY